VHIYFFSDSCILVPDDCTWGLNRATFIDDIIKHFIVSDVNIHANTNMSEHKGIDSIKTVRQFAYCL